MSGPDISNGYSIRHESEGSGFESSSGRDIFCLKNFDTFTKTPVRVSKMNAVAHPQLAFQMLTLLLKYLIQFNSIVYSDSEDPSIQRQMNMLMWTNLNTTIINHSYKTIGHGKVDIRTLKDTSPWNTKINRYKHHKSYIQSHLSETEGQTNLYTSNIQ